MDILKTIAGWIVQAVSGIGSIFASSNSGEMAFTAAARWIFIVLAVFIVLRSVIALLKARSPSEVWAYLHLDDGTNIPITHWENTVGRGRMCDIVIRDMRISRNHGTLVRDREGIWTYMDLKSRNGAVINGKKIPPGGTCEVRSGDQILLGETVCTLYPVSLGEHIQNVRNRIADTRMVSPWPSLVAITIFQILTVIQLHLALGEKFPASSEAAFLGLMILMWVYVIVLRAMHRMGFEVEILAFFLSTLSLAVVATCFPRQVLKQFFAVAVGVLGFLFMCAVLRNLKRTVALKPLIYFASAALLVFNLFFATEKFGAYNWVRIGSFTMQPSEIVKVAFIWVGAATMEELFRRRNSLIFTVFSFFCFVCLAMMGDFGTALIFFITFVIISFLRSGDLTRLAAVLGVAFVAGLLVLRFRSYIAKRFAVWGHVWEDPSNWGYQQTRTMSASASGGLIGVGAGKGWLRYIPASHTDLVFGLISEEWGLIVALLMIAAIITLSIFAYRSIWAGRSTYYTIAGCAATSLLLFQSILNVFGSVDILPLTGVTFPFVSSGGTSMVASWGLLAFVKAADTRQNASLAVKLDDEEEIGAGQEEPVRPVMEENGPVRAGRAERRRRGGRH